MIIINHEEYDYGVYFNHTTHKPLGRKLQGKVTEVTECVIKQVAKGEKINDNGIIVAVGKVQRFLADTPNRKIGNYNAFKKAVASSKAVPGAVIGQYSKIYRVK